MLKEGLIFGDLNVVAVCSLIIGAEVILLTQGELDVIGFTLHRLEIGSN